MTKTALVTGASSGIGEETARTLHGSAIPSTLLRAAPIDSKNSPMVEFTP